eukprot:12412453-Karenia_brevis.AAC.1
MVSTRVLTTVLLSKFWPMSNCTQLGIGVELNFRITFNLTAYCMTRRTIHPAMMACHTLPTALIRKSLPSWFNGNSYSSAPSTLPPLPPS